MMGAMTPQRFAGRTAKSWRLSSGTGGRESGITWEGWPAPTAGASMPTRNAIEERIATFFPFGVLFRGSFFALSVQRGVNLFELS